jgi:hypothetical protein
VSCAARRTDKRSSRSYAALFWFTTLAHAASVVTRFDRIDAALSIPVRSAILFAQFPLLLIGGFFEARAFAAQGDGLKDFPMWMRIKSWPIRTSFTFACIYLCLTVLMTWGVHVGPIDPSPPETWPAWERAGWFAMFTFGMFFVFFLAASSWLIPSLRTLTSPLRRLPAAVAIPVLSAAGVALGYGAVLLVSWVKLKQGADVFHSLLDQWNRDPARAIALTMAMVWGPILLGLVMDRLGAKSDSAPT